MAPTRYVGERKMRLELPRTWPRERPKMKFMDVVKQNMRVVGVSQEDGRRFTVATPKGSSRKTKDKKIMTAPTPVTMATLHHLSAALAS